MRRLGVLVLILLVTNLILVVAQNRPTALGPDPVGQPKNLTSGQSHRFYIWRDDTGWHLRTTTGREKHFFTGVVTVVGGKVGNFKTFQFEKKDTLKINSTRTQLAFDFATDTQIDGFDFQTDAQSVNFDLRMDGKRNADVIYIGSNGQSPKNVPFELNNKASAPTGSGGVAELIIPFGQPAGMGAGSSQRYLIWRDNNGWHLRTTTGRNKHTFSGEIIADSGFISEVFAISTERKDWVVLKDPRRVVFNLNTDGAIDGFDFRTNANNLRFNLNIDGKLRPNVVYIGSRAANPPAVPFTLSAK
ncbi:MAG: hypothetical protein WAQ98_23745 [Blastocatellia bacterium]